MPLVGLELAIPVSEGPQTQEIKRPKFIWISNKASECKH